MQQWRNLVADFGTSEWTANQVLCYCKKCIGQPIHCAKELMFLLSGENQNKFWNIDRASLQQWCIERSNHFAFIAATQRVWSEDTMPSTAVQTCARKNAEKAQTISIWLCQLTSKKLVRLCEGTLIAFKWEEAFFAVHTLYGNPCRPVRGPFLHPFT